MDILNELGRFISPYIGDISVALVACTLVVLGNDINSLLRSVLRKRNFILRTCIFILVTAFGYGLIIVKLSPYLAYGLKQLDPGMMFIAILIGFILIGLWAQKNRQI